MDSRPLSPPPPPPRILFGVMSAVHPARTVQDLVDSLGTRHRVLVHHDFSQQADFSVEGPTLSFVDRPAQTGWGEWAFTQGIVRLLEAALEGPAFDYFQLLSPTCLPIRPIRELERHLGASGADFHADFLRLEDDPTTLMSHGWRAYSRENSLRFRLLRRCYLQYFGNDLQFENRVGLGFPKPLPADAPLPTRLLSQAGLRVMRQAARGRGFSHAFSDRVPCHAGGTWFNASRRGCEYLVGRSREAVVARGFSKIHMPDEFLFPTMIAISGLKVASGLHYVSRFDGARPMWLEPGDLAALDASGRFIARKFRVEVDDPLRVAINRRVRPASLAETGSVIDRPASAPPGAAAPRQAAGTTTGAAIGATTRVR